MDGSSAPIAPGRARSDPAFTSGAARRSPAPGGLELVRSFLNTSDIEAGVDVFATPAGIEAWLQARELSVAHGEVTEDDRRRLVAFREALRELITCRERGDTHDAPLGSLHRAARSSPLIVVFDTDGHAALRTIGSGATGLIGTILGEISVAAVAGTWTRLKICRNDACRWAYYDASRNRSGAWCSMAVCGNRAKGRALRARRRTSAPTDVA